MNPNYYPAYLRDDLVTPRERLAPHEPLASAIRWLRTQSKKGYCLDKRVPKQPQSRHQTILDKWSATR